MSTRIKADGDTWRPILDESAGRRSLVFFCASNGQRPYRVVVAGDDLKTDEDVAALPAEELRAMFDRSESMNTSPS
ncbi:MAG: hypothetical protein E4H28_00425 [Gemmatimonadales bacterium]|jgi:hypothetical protein|nr:MAG: hypothetical protein E4H28_00425 [Gemmatimonadales bacterium]